MICTEHLSTKEVIEYLASKGINSFWHFTDASNLESIKKYGLKSLWEIKRNNIKVNRFGGNELSHFLDYYTDLASYVHLAFIDDHPMYYIAKKEKRIINPVWIKIDINILSKKECYFCTTVANKIGANLYTFDKIKELDLNKMFHWDFDIKKEARKAEILVKGNIEPYFIKGFYYGN
jgi:hypothetical protein